ncbi:MAG: glycosyltransferase family 2 protein [Chloroflexia bacterium]
MSGAPLCSVIVVNWNGRELLGPCLEGLREQRWQDFEVLLVDNASSDGSAAWVRTHFPEVHVIESARNLGFAGGANVGFAAARGEYLVVLNNDTRPEPQFLEALVEAAREDARVGMVAGVLVFAHRPDHIASAGIRMQWDGVAIDHLAGQPRSSLPDAPVEVFGPSGGAALYRRAMIREIGPFREELFAYLEDAELAWRARLAGWRCLLAPGAVVRHVYSATSGLGSPFKSFALARNRLLLLFLVLPGGLWLRFFPFIAAYDLSACAYGLLVGDLQVVRGRFAALRALSGLWGERRALQKRRRVALRDLARLLDPPMAPWSVLRLRRAIARLAGAI